MCLFDGKKCGVLGVLVTVWNVVLVTVSQVRKRFGWWDF